MTTNQTIDGVPRKLLSSLLAWLERANDRNDDGDIAEYVELRALLDAERCTSCDGSGDLIDLTGEWRGYCICPAGVELKSRPVPDATAATLARKYDDTLMPFLALMRKELHANADKGDRPGWLSMTADTCMLEIIYHFGKLQASVKRGDGDGMAEYGADVANLCMMLLDICGVINLVRHAEQPAPVAVVLPARPRADEEEYERMTDYEKGILHGGIELWDKLDELTRLYAARPVHANPPPGAEPSGTHPHNDGLDGMRKPAMCDCNQGRLPCRCKP